MLNKKNINKIAEFCGEDVAAQWRGLEHKYRCIDKACIVNTGVVSSGKSSIFNALINCCEQEHFPTGAARTTVAADEYSCDNISFIDTPGIDVRTEDDLVAFETVVTADLVMIIHNVKTGVLVQNEVDWLKRIAENIGKDGIAERVIFICSWADARDGEAEYPYLLNDIKNAVVSALGCEVPFFEVSAKRYFKGQQDKKEKLVEKSGIDQLRDYIHSKANNIVAEKSLRLTLDKAALIKKTSDILSERRKSCMSEIEKIRIKVTKQFSSKFNAWKSTFDLFKSMRKRYEALKKEYNSI